MEAIKYVLNIDIFCDYNQRFTRDKLYEVCPQLTQQQYNDIVEAKKGMFGNYISETTLNHNLVKILKALRSNECETILLTQCHQGRAMSICSYYDIAKLFTGLYFYEDKVQTKYDVLKRKGYDMNSIVLFENENEGKEEAVRNGIVRENIICVKF